jgi:DeoR/GlpR family transcriptional regulator of sugar metabolism
MLARHRQSLILQAIRSDGSARVSDLTQRLGVSDMTIRRDLEVLAREGLVEKVHGGAVLPGSPASNEPGFEAKLVLERPEKSAIARAAAGLVRPGTAIALAGGTTTFALAQCLLDVPGLTIVTNSLRVTNLFNGTRGLDTVADSVVLTGGVRTPSDSLVGPVADLTIRSLHFDLLFLGCYGIDIEAGLTTPNLAEAETNRTLIRVARRVVVLADHTKWGLVSLSSFADLSDVDVLITDDMLSADARALAGEHVGEVLVADGFNTRTLQSRSALANRHDAGSRRRRLRLMRRLGFSASALVSARFLASASASARFLASASASASADAVGHRDHTSPVPDLVRCPCSGVLGPRSGR